MSEDRVELSIDHFEKALQALKLALMQPEDEFIRDSVIKRFELCFEAARKSMRRWLMEQGELAASDTKKAVMEAAFRTGLIKDSVLWDQLGAARNDTAHEYDQNKAIEIAAVIRQKAELAFDTLLGELKGRA